MRVSCPHCGGGIDVDPAQAGNVVPCPHPTCGREMTIPPAAQVAQPLPPMERCYDCGDPIEGKVYRRTVRVGSSHTSGTVYTPSSGRIGPRSVGGGLLNSRGGGFGTYGGSTSTYAKVSLCPDCNRERDEAAARAFWWSVAFVVLALCALAVAFAFLRGAPSLQGAAPEPKDPPVVKEPPLEAKKPPPPADRPDPRPKPPRGGAVPLPPADAPELLPLPVEFPEPLPPPKVAPTPPTPEQLAKDRERRAGLYLRAAQEKLHDSYKREALDILEEIVRKFPDTAAAKEAREMWEKLNRD